MTENEKVCCECGGPLNYRCVFYNGPQRDATQAGDGGLSMNIITHDEPMWKFIGPDTSCHLECYIDICVQKALERLGK